MIAAPSGDLRPRVQRVYSSSSLWEAREVLALLLQQGIPASLVNEHIAGTPGVLPLNALMSVDAEVWVMDDEFAPRCARLIAEFQRAPGDAGSRSVWHCSHCREECPGGFQLCWSCGQPAPESPTACP